MVSAARAAAGLIVYDPRGSVKTSATPLAKRLSTLDGKRVAFLDNTKWNADNLLRKVAGNLGQEYKLAAVNFYRKECMSWPAEPELVDRIVANNDVVFEAIGE